MGSDVYFLSQEPPEKGQNPIASCVLVYNHSVEGTIRYVNTLKNFAIASVADNNGNGRNLYIQLSPEGERDARLGEGVNVRFRVSRNAQGVCGADPIVV